MKVYFNWSRRDAFGKRLLFRLHIMFGSKLQKHGGGGVQSLMEDARNSTKYKPGKTVEKAHLPKITQSAISVRYRLISYEIYMNTGLLNVPSDLALFNVARLGIN